jgi:hypothetical protein
MLGISITIMVILSAACIALTGLAVMRIFRFQEQQSMTSEPATVSFWTRASIPQLLLALGMIFLSTLSLFTTFALHWLSRQPHIFG